MRKQTTEFAVPVPGALKIVVKENGPGTYDAFHEGVRLATATLHPVEAACRKLRGSVPEDTVVEMWDEEGVHRMSGRFSLWADTIVREDDDGLRRVRYREPGYWGA